jgi:uncharacterized membrane protein
MLTLALSGVFDATYLTIKHYVGGAIPCGIFSGCETVLNSSYSVMLGIPLALYGVAYYLAILILTLWYLDRRIEIVFHLLTRSTVLGFLFSVWFVYLQVVVIGAICTFCMISALISTVLFLCGAILTLDHLTRVHHSEFPVD